MSQSRIGFVLRGRDGQAVKAHALAMELQRRLGSRDIVVQDRDQEGVENREIQCLFDMGRAAGEDMVRDTLDRMDRGWREVLEILP